MKYPTVFMRDAVTGLVIPEINPECAWVQSAPSKDTILQTIMLDGIKVKIQNIQGTPTRMIRETNKPGDKEEWGVCERQYSEDKVLFEAYDALSTKTPGTYIVYGPEIKGNPQRVNKHLMMKILPVDNDLIMYGLESGIKRWGVDVQTFYDSMKQALEEGDAEGVVFQIEKPAMHLERACQIKRTDFGLPWPLPPKAVPQSLKACATTGCLILMDINTKDPFCSTCRSKSYFARNGTHGNVVPSV